jgi:hypothetical protein
MARGQNAGGPHATVTAFPPARPPPALLACSALRAVALGGASAPGVEWSEAGGRPPTPGNRAEARAEAVGDEILADARRLEVEEESAWVVDTPRGGDDGEGGGWLYSQMFPNVFTSEARVGYAPREGDLVRWRRWLRRRAVRVPRRELAVAEEQAGHQLAAAAVEPGAVLLTNTSTAFLFVGVYEPAAAADGVLVLRGGRVEVLGVNAAAQLRRVKGTDVRELRRLRAQGSERYPPAPSAQPPPRALNAA